VKFLTCLLVMSGSNPRRQTNNSDWGFLAVFTCLSTTMPDSTSNWATATSFQIHYSLLTLLFDDLSVLLRATCHTTLTDNTDIRRIQIEHCSHKIWDRNFTQVILKIPFPPHRIPPRLHWKNVGEIVAVFSGNRKKRITRSGKNAEIFKANQVLHVCHNSYKHLVSPTVLTSLQQKQTSLVIKMALLRNKKR
jgi:hypothetical protein